MTDMRERMIDAVLAEMERTEYVKEWPEDERDYQRNGWAGSENYAGGIPMWHDFTDRREKLQRYRAGKAVDAVLAIMAPRPFAEKPVELEEFGEVCGLCKDCGLNDYARACGKVHDCEACEARRRGESPWGLLFKTRD